MLEGVSKVTYGIHLVGKGDSWFCGFSKEGNSCFDSRPKATLFATEEDAQSALIKVPECVRKWFQVEAIA